MRFGFLGALRCVLTLVTTVVPAEYELVKMFIDEYLTSYEPLVHQGKGTKYTR